MSLPEWKRHELAEAYRAEAVAAARDMIARLGTGKTERTTEGSFIQRSDSVSMNDLHRRAEQEWLAPTVWAGAIRTHGAAAIALVGSPDEIAAAIAAALIGVGRGSDAIDVMAAPATKASEPGLAAAANALAA